MRLVVIAAVVKAWLIVGVVALVVPHLLSLFVALVLLYSVGAPPLLEHLQRDVDRRTIGVADTA